MACEYGPMAAGACLEVIGCLLTLVPPRQNSSTLLRDLETGFEPRVDTALQRAHALEPDLAQPSRELDRALLVRARAIHHDLSVMHEIAHAFEGVDVDGASTGND